MDARNVARELREAIREGDLAKVTRLVAEDPPRLTMTTPFGTWLHVAASFGQLDVVKYLVERGADVNACGGIEGAAPLDAAAGEGHLDVVRHLIAHGAVLDVSEPHRNPLFAAIYGGHVDVARALVDAGIDTTVKYSGESMKEMDAAAFAREHHQPAIERMLTPRPDGNRAAVRVAPPESGSPADDVIRHMGRHFGPVDELALTEILPVSGIKIHAIRGRAPGQPTILFTTGLSDEPQNVPPGNEKYRYAELFARIPYDWPLAIDALTRPERWWPVEWLEKIALYPRENDTWLGAPFTIVANGEPPAPLGAGTKQTCLLLLCETEEPNPIRCRDGRSICLYSFVPLHTKERDLEREQGIEALLERLSAQGASFIVDPARPSAVTGP